MKKVIILTIFTLISGCSTHNLTVPYAHDPNQYLKDKMEWQERHQFNTY